MIDEELREALPTCTVPRFPLLGIDAIAISISLLSFAVYSWKHMNWIEEAPILFSVQSLASIWYLVLAAAIAAAYRIRVGPEGVCVSGGSSRRPVDLALVSVVFIPAPALLAAGLSYPVPKISWSIASVSLLWACFLLRLFIRVKREKAWASLDDVSLDVEPHEAWPQRGSVISIDSRFYAVGFLFYWKWRRAMRRYKVLQGAQSASSE